MAYELIDEPAARWELVDEPAAEPLTAKKAVRKLGTASIPLIGTTLAAFGVEVDPAAVGKGIASGFADVGNTLMNRGTKTGADLVSSLPESPLTEGLPGRRKPAGLSNLITGQPNRSPSEIYNADREASLKAFNKENDSASFAGGRLIGNIAATAPLGGAGGTLLRAASPRLAPLAESVASGGFRTGMAPTTLAGRAGNVATRAAGGGITGGASAGLVNPEDAGTGALIGAFLPGSVQFVNAAGDLAGRGYRALRGDPLARPAASILEMGGYRTPEQVAEVRSALTAQGPSLIQAPPTVPQILQNPDISQLGRTLRNAGDTKLLAAEQAQDAARFAALDRISPVTGTVQQSADNFGNALQTEVRAADEAARRRTQAAFDAVDPFNETAFLLPIDEMRAAQQRYLGRGTFNGGANATRAIDTARNIGEETIDAVTPARAGLTQDDQTLVQAIRRAGGINMGTPAGRTFEGELRDLRQTPGLRGIVGTNRGQPIDTLAQRMHAEGFIPDDDPATLLNALRDPDLAGRRGAAADADRVFQAMREASMGDAPEAMTIRRPVPFREVQNLRSSIGEAHAEAQAKGRTREAAALDQMRRDIDSAVDEVAAGNGQPGENFPGDIVDQWREALRLHQDRMNRFRTGPQASMFRQGGDGLPAAQGGELAAKFFSPRASQTDDIAAFGRIASPNTTGLLKNYAITDAANQTDRLGRLTNNKFNNWQDARSGAIEGLFDDSERATLRAVGKDLRRADEAENLNRATGSNTSQNQQSALSLGLLDRPWINALASRTPIIGRFSGPMLEGLRQSGRKARVDQLGTLLADPATLDRAIADYLSQSVRSPSLLRDDSQIAPLLLRASPLIASDRF